MKHGLHRPERCCIRCHQRDILEWDVPAVLQQLGLDMAPTYPYADMDDEPKPYVGHDILGFYRPLSDRGAKRTMAAKRFTSEMAGDRW